MIRRLFKWVFRLVLMLMVLVVLLLVFKDTIIRIIVEHRIEAETGMKAKIGRMSVGLFSPEVTVESLRVYNTPEFGGNLFLDVPELHIEYDRAALIDGKLHLTLLRLNLAELNLVRNEAGQTNWAGIKKAHKRYRKAHGKHDVFDEVTFTGIDVLNYSLGKARFIDLKDPGQNREVQMNLKNEVVRDVKSNDALYGVLLPIWMRYGGELGIPVDEFFSGSLNRSLDKFKSDANKLLNGTQKR
jgi:uncharacterized protein involved in outer membrane biogenesis